MEYVDESVFLWINGWVGNYPAFDRVMGWVVSDYLVPANLMLSLIFIWFVGNTREARLRHQIGVFVALSSMGCASLGVFIANSIYFRPRPFVDHEVSLLFYQPTDSSFPANSTAVAVAVAVAVWGVNRRIGCAMFAVAVVYGFARVYAGVHYPLDIIGGAAIGVGVAYTMPIVMQLAEPLPTAVIRGARIFCLA